MAILCAYYEYIMNICFTSKFALGISSVLSFCSDIWYAISSLFPIDLTCFVVSNQKPIYIIETVKQIGWYLNRYDDNRVYDLGLIICK